MACLTATALLVLLLTTTAAHGATGGFDLTISPGDSYTWKSGHVFTVGDAPTVTRWTIDGQPHNPWTGLQIGPCAWHWLIPAGDWYVYWPCLWSKTDWVNGTPFRLGSHGTNWLDRPVTVSFRWALDNG